MVIWSILLGNRKARWKSWLSWSATILAVSGAWGVYSWSLWGSPGFGHRADQAYHLHLAEEFDRAWRDGDFPPRWVAGANGGRGSVGFVVYPPLFAFLSACCMRLGTSPVDALRLAVLTSATATFAAVLFLARTWLSWRRALLAAAAVLLLPGVSFVALGRGMFPQFAALAWAALFLGAGQRAMLRRRVRLNAALALVATVGLVLTHTLSAYLLLLFLVAISPLLGSVLGVRRIAWAVAIATAAASLTCWYWLPLLSAGSYTRVAYLAQSHPYLESVFGGGGHDAREIFGQDWIFLNDLGRYIVIAQSLLALLLTLALPGKPTNSQPRRDAQHVPPGGVLFLRALPWVAGFAFLAATEPGARLLLELPGAALFQFAWRWQLLISLWCGVALASLPRTKASAPPAILALATLAFFSPLFSASKRRPHDQPRDPPAVLTEPQYNRLPPRDRPAYAGNLLEHRPNPIDTNYYARAPFGRAEIVRGEAGVEPRVLKTSHREYRVAAVTAATIQIVTYHAPGWSARLNLRPVEIQVDCETGLQRIPVPPGTHRLVLEYEPPWPWE